MNTAIKQRVRRFRRWAKDTRDAHREQRRDERGLSTEAVAEVSEDHRADGARDLPRRGGRGLRAGGDGADRAAVRRLGLNGGRRALQRGV